MNRRTFFLGAGGGVVLAAGATAWMSSTGSMADYDAYAESLRTAPAVPPSMRDVIRYATLAANSHNTQPWRFRIGNRFIEIAPDVSRRTPAVDPDDHHLFVSLGCAAENLAIAATSLGWPGELQIAPDGNLIRYAFVNGPTIASPLYAAIPKRQSTRAEYDRRSVPAAHLALLKHTADTAGVHLAILTNRADIDRLKEQVVAANSIQMADMAFMRELKQWVRFNPRSAMTSGDGLFSATSGNPALPDAIGRFAFERFFNARSESDRCARQVDSSSGVAVFAGDREDKAHWIMVGRACQRFALTATSLGIKVAFINQPVEVARFRADLAGLVGIAGRRPDIVLRFGYGATLPLSLRRPVEAVLTR